MGAIIACTPNTCTEESAAVDSPPVIVITGASRGIGAAAASHLAALDVQLVLTARTERALLDAIASGWTMRHDALLLNGDLTAPESATAWVSSTLARFGRIDALINNAGVIEPLGALADADPEAATANLNINLLAPVRATQAALPALRASMGRIVNVSSGAGLRPVPGWGAYCTAKAGLNNFTRVLAVEEPDIVSVAYSPGMTDTDMQAMIRRDGPDGMPAPVLRRFTEAFEAGGLNSVEDAGRALAALALLAGPELSGEYIAIDDARMQTLSREFERLL